MLWDWTSLGFDHRPGGLNYLKQQSFCGCLLSNQHCP